jgi:hypothetical protein
MRNSLGLAIFFLLLFLRSTAAFGTSFAISPPRVEMSVRPMSAHDVILTVITSPGDEPIFFSIYVLDFRLERDGTIEYFEAGALDRSASSWLTFDTDRFKLNPTESKKVKVRIEVPRGAVGGYYSAIVVDQLPRADIPEGRAALVHTMKFVSLVELRVVGHGRVREDAAITGLDVEYSAKVGGLQAVVSVENRGVSHIKSKGELVIRTRHGGRVALLPLVPGRARGLVLPGSVRDLSIPFARRLPSGDYVAEAKLEYGMRRKSAAKYAFSIAGGKLAASGKFVEAEGVDFLVDPYLVDITARGGAFRAIPILVQNDEDVPIRVSTRSRPIGFSTDGEIITPESGNEWSCVDWIELQPAEFELDPGRKRRVVAKLRVPKDAVGGRSAHITFTAAMSAAEGPKPVESTAGTVLLLKIPGKELVVNGEISKIKVAQGAAGEAGTFVVTLKNNGNAHLVPTGTIVIRPEDKAGEQGSGSRVAAGAASDFFELQFNEIIGAVLPESVRDIVAQLPAGLPPGTYLADITIDLGGKTISKTEYKFTVK